MMRSEISPVGPPLMVQSSQSASYRMTSPVCTPARTARAPAGERVYSGGPPCAASSLRKVSMVASRLGMLVCAVTLIVDSPYSWRLARRRDCIPHRVCPLLSLPDHACVCCLIRASAVSAASLQPLSMVSEWPRFSSTVISVAAAFRVGHFPDIKIGRQAARGCPCASCHACAGPRSCGSPAPCPPRMPGVRRRGTGPCPCQSPPARLPLSPVPRRGWYQARPPWPPRGPGA